MTSAFAYLFEAKGIQRYIIDSGRLSDLIGGSDLIAALCASDRQDLLAAVLEALGEPNPRESRRAGAAFCLHSEQREPLDRLRALWRLAVGLRHPGLEFVDSEPTVGDDDMHALALAYRSQSAVRENSAAFLPPTGHSFVRFNPRTGRLAVAEISYGGTQETELVDHINAPQRRRGSDLARDERTDRLARVFLPENSDDARAYLFPRQFERREAGPRNPAFPLFGSDNRVAVVHADISGLGQVFQKVTSATSEATAVLGVANAIEAAVAAAARAASERVSLPAAVGDDHPEYALLFGPQGATQAPAGRKIIPARPLVLGGDDVTIIVRADLAIAFVRELLLEIERFTEEAFKELDAALGLPARLTACAGVAIVGAGHPFLAAHRMAEGLCKIAKASAKESSEPPFPSYLSFAVITSTVDEDYADYREREQHSVDGTPLNAATYAVLLNEGGPASLAQLTGLAKALDAAPGRGKLIEALGLRYDDAGLAQAEWQRFWHVLRAENQEAARVLKDSLVTCAPGAGNSNVEGNPSLDEALPYINDALELIDIGALEPFGDET